MNNQIQYIIDDCNKGREVRVTEDSLMKCFPDMMAWPTDQRSAMRKGMNEWLLRTEEIFNIEWVRVENYDKPTYYVFRLIMCSANK